MKKICLLLCGLFLVTGNAFAQEKEVKEETRKICNQVMTQIYYDILEVKKRYRELSQFDENAFFENKEGFYTIVYEYKEEVESPEGAKRIKRPFSFALTIESMGGKTFPPRAGSFAFSFDAIDLKFSGYQNKRLLRRQFDLMPVIAKRGKHLYDYQQRFLPLRLSLRPLKEAFSVRENIGVEVILTNVSKANMVVKDLKAETLALKVNGGYWGASYGKSEQGLSPAKRRLAALRAKRAAKKAAQSRSKVTGVPGLLKAGESITLILKGESFQQPQEVEVEATYKIPVRGVNPTASVKFPIIE